jgi:hypothetical protein
MKKIISFSADQHFRCPDSCLNDQEKIKGSWRHEPRRRIKKIVNIVKDKYSLTIKFKKMNNLMLSIAFTAFTIVSFGQISGPRENPDHTASQSTSPGQFCKELNFIMSSMQDGKLAEIVDYNKALGITQSWFAGKVELTGFRNLKGQSLFGNLSFVGILSESDTNDNEKLYKAMVGEMENCLTGYRKEKTEYGTGVMFINKNDKNLYLSIKYYGAGEYVELDISRYK